MDKFSYAIGLGIGQNLLSMGAKGIAVDDFAQAIKDVLEGNQTAISHTEARDIVNKYFAGPEDARKKIEFVISTEPTDGGIYRGHRGRMEIRVDVKGVSCHGSAPERGDNENPIWRESIAHPSKTSVTMPKQPTKCNATTKAH